LPSKQNTKEKVNFLSDRFFVLANKSHFRRLVEIRFDFFHIFVGAVIPGLPDDLFSNQKYQFG
jgi:hypothetical protein